MRRVRPASSALSMTKAGTFTLTATSSGLAAVVSSSYTIKAATAQTLTLVNQPQNQIAGLTINATPVSSSKYVTVQVVDPFGNSCYAPSGDKVTLGIAYANSSASVPLFSGGGRIAFSSTGQAVFSTLLENAVGTYTLTGRQPASLVGVQSKSLVISYAQPAKLSFVNGPTDASAGNNFNTVTPTPMTLPLFPNGLGTTQLWASVSLPGTGRPVFQPRSQRAVSLSVSSRSAVLEAVRLPRSAAGFAPLVTNGFGVVTFSNLTENKAGSYKLSAATPTAATSALRPTSASFIIKSSDAYGLSFSVQPTSTQVGKPISAVKVQIVDKYGNPYDQSANISLALSGTASLGGTKTSSTSTSGIAIFSTLQVTRTGTYCADGDGDDRQ